MMQRPSRTAHSVRATAVGITLLGHAALLLLFEIERRAPRREQADLQFVDIWLSPLRDSPAPPAESDAGTPPSRSHAAPPAVHVIQLAVASQAAEPDTASVSPSQASVDWNAEAAKAVARSADAIGKAVTFSPQPKGIAEPCKPRVFDKETKKLMAERLPEPSDPNSVGPNPQGNCLVVGGRPMCVQTMSIPLGSIEPAGDLFEDMQKGKVPESSVPSPHFCD